MIQDVTQQAKDRAKIAVSEHPLWAEATAHVYCEGDVFSIEKEFVERAQITEKDRDALRAALADVDTVLVVAYYTAEMKPEPLTGSGNLYNFLLHPDSFSVLHSDVGTWRS
jgi:hypothetical protein